jgi:cytochrome c
VQCGNPALPPVYSVVFQSESFDVDQGKLPTILVSFNVTEPANKKVPSFMSLFKIIAVTAASLFVLATSPAAAQVDASAAESLMKKSGCTKCHSVSAKKEGPPYKETAAKYKDKPDAEAQLFKHLTTNPKVKVEDKEELHDNLKTKNESDIRNVVRWILSR